MTQVLKEQSKDIGFSDETLLRITDIIVKKFVKNKSIKYDDFDDFKQTILEKYFSKKNEIIESFAGKSKPETYLSAVIYRTALNVLRNQHSYNKQQSDIDPTRDDLDRQKVINPEELLILEDEKRYLERILQTLPDKHKAILFLKCYYRLEVSRDDVKQYSEILALNGNFEILSSTTDKNDKSLYEDLCTVENLLRSKKVKPDAVRMYINKTADAIVGRLNGRSRRTGYDKESLGLLFEQLLQPNYSKK